jgi:hypothetical protein
MYVAMVTPSFYLHKTPIILSCSHGTRENNQQHIVTSYFSVELYLSLRVSILYAYCSGEGEDATLRSMPSPTSLHQQRQDDGQTHPSSHTSPDEDL